MTAGDIRPDTAVRLVGLASQPTLNGMYGRCLSYDAAKERFGVSIVVGGASKSLALRRQNLVPMAQLTDADTSSLQRDAKAARAADAHELALALFTACVALDGSEAENHLGLAAAFEGLGRKREAYDALLVGRDATSAGSSPRLHSLLKRLEADGVRDGWLQHSQQSHTEAAYRTSTPHCAVCLKPTPPGRPPPEASCGVCGMVQYCGAAHKLADAGRHRRACGALRPIAWRMLWDRHPASPAALEVTLRPAADARGRGGKPSTSTLGGSQGFGVRVAPGAPHGLGRAVLVDETTFPVLSASEVGQLDSWDAFFQVADVQRRWLGAVPPPARAEDGSWAPQPPPGASPPGKRAVREHLSHALRCELGELLTDALTTLFALRAAGCLGHDRPRGDGGAPQQWYLHVLGAEEGVEGRRAALFHRAVSALVGAVAPRDESRSFAEDDGLVLEANDGACDGEEEDDGELTLEGNDEAAAAAATAPPHGARTVHTVHVGPGAASSPPACLEGGGTAASFRGSYEAFRGTAGYTPPDALAAFHAGIYVNSHGYTWLAVLEEALARAVPLVLTSMSPEDTRCTREVLDALDARVLLDSPNPFASPKPWQVYPCENLVHARNFHVFVVAGGGPRELSAAERRQRVHEAGREIMRRLQENPLEH